MSPRSSRRPAPSRPAQQQHDADAGGEDHRRLAERVVAAVVGQHRGHHVGNVGFLDRVGEVARRDMLVDGRVGRAEGRQHQRAPDQNGAGAERDEQRQQMGADRRHLGRLDQMQRRQQEHRRDAGADRRLGHGDVDGVEHDQHARHQEAVDAGEDDDAEQAALPDDGDRHDGKQRQQHHVDERYRWLPPVVRIGRPGASRAAAVFRQQRLDALMQAGLRERMRHDGAGEEEQREEKQELQRHQAEAGLQAHAEDQKADAERVGDARRVHAGEDVRHADEPERADDGEERAEEDQHPARDLDGQRHDFGSLSAS